MTAPTGTTRPPGALSAMSVDVEDYFQVSAFRPHVRPEDWASHPLRVERNLRRLLEVFDAAGVRATFFWLGWVAERLPALVREVADAGHEIASHGYQHIRAFEQSEAEFRDDVTRTRGILQDLSGRDVIGYRAASFSIDARNLWALDILEETGHHYSSSVSPINHDHYGMRSAPRFAFRLAGRRLVEIPVTTVEVGGWRMPCGGGGFFRLFPYGLSRAAIGRVTASEGQPGVFYFHPWEIDPGQPRLPGIDLRTRFRHYVNLARFERKLCRLLADFRWAPMREAFGPVINGTAPCGTMDFPPRART